MMNRATAERWWREELDSSEANDVPKMHAAVLREHRDPRAVLRPLPGWLAAVYVLTLFAAGFYGGRYTGTFRGDGLDPSAAAGSTRATAAPANATLRTAGVAEEAGAKENELGVVRVVIQNMQFSPAALRIKRGETVEWTNNDITPHTVTSGAFDSGSIESDKTWRHTFKEEGQFAYACTFHPDMKGKVIVE